MNPIRQSAIDTINAEAAAVQHLVEQLTDDFEKAVQAILTCKGKVIVTGMGKSGLIGKKIAATLASTGTPAFFMHPGEAYHGDLGMISISVWNVRLVRWIWLLPLQLRLHW